MKGVPAVVIVLLQVACSGVQVTPPSPGAEPWGHGREARRTATDRYDGEDEGENTGIPENLFVELPAPPETWIKFSVRGHSRHETAIDPASVSVGGDGITRYAMLIRAGRVDNVSFEGIRCATRTWKLYATGREDGGWTRVPAPEWRPIEETSVNAVRFSLYRDYLCDRGGIAPKDSASVVQRLKDSKDGVLGKQIP